MTYTARVKDGDVWDLEDGDGNTILSDQPLPVTTPDDIIDAILDDMGVGSPQKQAFRALFKKDWETVDER